MFQSINKFLLLLFLFISIDILCIWLLLSLSYDGIGAAVKRVNFGEFPFIVPMLSMIDLCFMKNVKK